ncbi:SusC/RagA family TonB-linked outer membrane protein [Flagellimonas sp.]|uniref:SusC/RagA family TonB-linked outer membrane protein n=1 Tax=Flagellimonas sp. TaxID=2058762 RepID=UPI003F49BE4A
MKQKIRFLSVLVLLLSISNISGQEKQISGTVTDTNNLPLPGVSIVVVGTTNGTQTDFDGNYTISASIGQVLRFTYLGQKTVERTVGPSNTINVEMEEDAEALEEVVVTALGIERTARSIGYGVNTVKAEELNEVRETNVLSALQGKSSGILITNQSGNVGGSQRILIRGNSSLAGTVQPLFVVDGVPISNNNTATGSRTTVGLDFGNRAQDINPDDVESVTILKGASAAALYGSRASGGAIIITTKKGKPGTRASLTFSSSYRFDEPLRLPDFQNEFAAGDQGVYDFTQDPGNQVTSGFGPSIASLAGQTYTNIAGEEVPFEVFPDNVENFYSTGFTSIYNLNVSGSSEPGDDYRMSISYTDQGGIVPNQRLNRTNIGLNAGKNLTDKLSSRFSVNYVRTNTTGTAAGGANNPNVLTSIVNLLPRTTDFDLFTPDVDEFGNQLNDPGGQQNNPFFIANQNAPRIEVERFFGNASLTYKPFEGLSLLGRAGYDTFNDRRLLQNSIGTIGNIQGNFTQDVIGRRELTLDFIATYEGSITNDLNFTARGGTQWNERVFERLQNFGQNLAQPELFSPANAAVNNVLNDLNTVRIFGVFGDITLDYKNWLILNATGRNDWSSTLFPDDNSFFYPSVSLSFVFSDAFNIQSDILSYGKLRGSWANVGGDTTFGQLNFFFTPDTGFFRQFLQPGTFPFGGNLAFNSRPTLTDPNLKPSNQRNYEAGIELGFFKNRINLDVTYYDNLNEDDIVFVPTPQSSGFSFFLTNVGGVSNSGVEIELNARVLQTKDFSWDLDYNFTKNDQIVEDLDEIEGGALNLANEFNGLSVRAEEGQPFQLFGPRWRRAQDADGNDIEDAILVDENGIRQIGQPDNIGAIQPDWQMGLTSTFKYKGFSLSTTFDWREGGLLFSNTVGALRRTGLAAETAVDRDNLFVDPNTFTQPGGPGTAVIPNTTPISSVQNFYANGFSNGSIAEGNIFDATFIKWRELSLSYTFESKILERTPLKGLQVGIQGRNLALFNTSVPHIDPESGLGGSASQFDGIERGGIPTTRSIGFNIIANF